MQVSNYLRQCWKKRVTDTMSMQHTQFPLIYNKLEYEIILFQNKQNFNQK